MTSHFGNGENYEGAICVGVYPDSDAEIWIEVPASRININVDDVNALCRQLKRAAKIAREQQS